MKIAPASSLAATAALLIACGVPGPDPRGRPDAPQVNEPAAQGLVLDAGTPATGPQSACHEQPPQDFLIRTHFYFLPEAGAADAHRREKQHQVAIRYRTEQYGHVKGFGEALWNRYDPVHYSELTTFFGIKVRMNRRIIPALHCVEEEIKAACSATPYKPGSLHGIRFRNTYHTGEITNHAYGIAIDIDPERNPCCGCLPPASDSPRCKGPPKSPYDIAGLPKCWVDSFVKYGFYWLGDDPMQDTMHFEFLGDPDKVLKASPGP